MQRLLLLCMLVASTATGVPLWAQSPADNLDTRLLREARPVAVRGRIAVFADGVDVDTAFATVADRALVEMERRSGRRWDEATLGPQVRVIVASRVTVSHVWRGYEHPQDPQPILYLNPRVARLAFSGRNATYAHELAHLLTWRYHSHTLREGIADWLALALHPGAGVGPNVEGYANPPAVTPDILAVLGTTAPAPASLSTDATVRSAYYYASYRFVEFLIARGGIERFWRVYDAADPAAAMPSEYGASREELVRLAFTP